MSERQAVAEGFTRDRAQKMRVQWLVPECLPVKGDRIESRDQRGYWLVHHAAPLMSAVGCDPARPWLFIIASRHEGAAPEHDAGAFYDWSCTGLPGLLLPIPARTAGRPRQPIRRDGWRGGERDPVWR